jgi:hypothetical protein
MALRTLAGPFALVDDADNPVTPLYTFPCMWLPNTGLILATSDPALAIVTLDGIVEVINRTMVPPYEPWFSNEAWGWDDARGRLFHILDQEYTSEPIALCAYATPSGFPVVDWHTAQVPAYVDLQDRRLCYYSHRVQSAAAGGSFAPEDDGSVSLNGLVLVGPGRQRGEIFLAGQGSSGDTTCVFYNTQSRLYSSPVLHLGLVADAVVFAPEFGVIVAVQSSPANQITVFALEGLPTALSNPALLSGGINQGEVATYRVQLTGAQGEPVAGELVKWSHTGAGTLLDEQTETDANGHATARVCYAPTDSGSTQIGAAVAC